LFSKPDSTTISTLSLHDALPICRYDHGSRALDFGCGTVRSTDSRSLGLNVIRADSSHAMLDQARALEPSGEYHRVRDNITGEFRSEEHTSELQSRSDLVCRLLLE